MNDAHRFAFRVRKGGTHYFNSYGEETDKDGNVLIPPEPDYRIPGDEQQIIAEHKRRRLVQPQTTEVQKEEDDASSQALYPGEG